MTAYSTASTNTFPFFINSVYVASLFFPDLNTILWHPVVMKQFQSNDVLK